MKEKLYRAIKIRNSQAKVNRFAFGMNATDKTVVVA